MSKDNGGPAFPCENLDIGAACNHLGMTLRDYFAAHAMHDGMARLIASGWANFNEYQLTQAAKQAYMCADAMLAARAEGQKE